MVSGNQAEAWKKAKEELGKNPGNRALQEAEATRREDVNKSLRAAKQKEVS